MVSVSTIKLTLLVNFHKVYGKNKTLLLVFGYYVQENKQLMLRAQEKKKEVWPNDKKL